MISDYLKPSLSNHGKELVYFSKYKNIAGFYIVKSDFYPYRFPNENNVLRYVEYFEDMFSYFYNGKNGFIYEVEETDDMYNPTQMDGLFVSEKQVHIKNRIDINNVYEYFMKEQDNGRFELIKHKDIEDDELNKIHQNLVKHIIRMGIEEDNNGVFANTIKVKLPSIWEKAIKEKELA